MNQINLGGNLGKMSGEKSYSTRRRTRGPESTDIPNKTKYEPCFKIEEDGSFKLLPLQLLVKSNSSKKRPIEKLNKLVLTPADFGELNRPFKQRRVEPSVRKELFKMPTESKFQSNRFSKSRRSINARQSLSKGKKSTLAKPLDMVGEIEKVFPEKSGYQFRSTSTGKLKINFTKMQSPKTSTPSKLSKRSDQSPVQISSPKTRSSADTEFLELEKNFNDIQSPVSSMCNLLQNTALNSGKMKTGIQKIGTDLSKMDSIKTIRNIIELDNAEFMRYTKFHNDNMIKINKILSDLENNSETNESDTHVPKENGDNKENVKRRLSQRFGIKSPILTVGSSNKKMVSPALIEAIDLRKTMLTRNLSKSMVNQKSPKVQKAVDLYNNLKSECSVLCTPKINRKGFMDVSGGASNVMYSLSKKVRDQCLMLQDTPVRQ